MTNTAVSAAGKLSVKLYDSLLDSAKSRYHGRFSARGFADVEDLAKDIVEGGSDIKYATLLACANLFRDAVTKKLKEGYSVNLIGVGRLTPAVHGGFNGSDVSLTKGKQLLTVRFRPHDIIKEVLETIPIDVTGKADTGPKITGVFDTYSETQDSILTPDRPLIMRGSRLRIQGEGSDIGIFFITIPKDSKTEQKRIAVDKKDIIRNNPSEVEIMIPKTLIKGDYAIELTTKFSSKDRDLNKARSFRYTAPLIVA